MVVVVVVVVVAVWLLLYSMISTAVIIGMRVERGVLVLISLVVPLELEVNLVIVCVPCLYYYISTCTLLASYKAGTSWCTTFECVCVGECVKVIAKG